MKHKSISKESTLEFPVLIMQPNTEYAHEYKGFRGLHVNPLWNPFSFAQGEFWLTEEEMKENPYAVMRMKQIDDDQNRGEY